MSEMKILFANIGWMTSYNGYSNSDPISSGGSYPANLKHEVFNFQNLDGFHYGYVQPTKDAINLKRIDINYDSKSNMLENVLVIWTAKHQKGGTYIIGWYNHATVYSSFQKVGKREYCFNVKARAKDCILIPVDKRGKLIPRGKGFMGQSNIWYADSLNDDVQIFKEDVVKYVNDYKPSKSVESSEVTVDPNLNKRIETAAIAYVTKQYEYFGYKIKSVEKENKGWDLEAEKGKIKLRLEVKGKLQKDIYIHISRNEYEKMNDKNNFKYR